MIPAWMTRAVCRDADPELFDPADRDELRSSHAGSAKELPRIQCALDYCSWCHVRQECHDDATNSVDYATWGVRGGEYITYPVATLRLRDARERAKNEEVTTVPETVEKETYMLELATLLKRFVISVHMEPAKASNALAAARALPGPPTSVDAVDWMLAAMVNPNASIEELLGWTLESVAEDAA